MEADPTASGIVDAESLAEWCPPVRPLERSSAEPGIGTAGIEPLGVGRCSVAEVDTDSTAIRSELAYVMLDIAELLPVRGVLDVTVFNGASTFSPELRSDSMGSGVVAAGAIVEGFPPASSPGVTVHVPSNSSSGYAEGSIIPEMIAESCPPSCSPGATVYVPSNSNGAYADGSIAMGPEPRKDG
jgi:hypothetical protein